MVATGFSGLGGSLGGALLAFLLEASRRKREEQKLRLAAGRRAIFVLISHHNQLANWVDQGLSEYRNQPARWAAIKPLLAVPTLELDLTSLMFLVDEGETTLLYDLLAEGMNLTATRMAVLERNERHRELRERYANAKPGDPGLVGDEKTIADIAGPELTAQLRGLTDSIYDGVAACLNLNRRSTTQLIAQLERLFPGERVIDLPFEVRQQLGLNAPSAERI